MQSIAVIRALRVVALSTIAVVVVLAGEPGRNGAVLGAQKSTNSQMPSGQIPSADQQDPLGKAHGFPDDSGEPRMPDRTKAINEDRHKRLESDVAKLVSLTNELKVNVDKTENDELSMDVIRKAQQIEKLAHDVQSRMKN